VNIEPTVTVALLYGDIYYELRKFGELLRQAAICDGCLIFCCALKNSKLYPDGSCPRKKSALSGRC
jgi:hypothetical protein